MKFINRVNNWIKWAEEWILLAIVMFMVILSFLQVVLRNFFDVGLLWGDILLRHLVLWVGFIGASIATKEGKHINIDLLNRIFKGRWTFLIKILTDLFSAFISIYLALAAYHFVLDEKEFGTTIFNDIPVWGFQIIIPLGFLLMGLRFIIAGLNTLSNDLVGGRK
jgi:C4-dicarboxylate transporter DctQ subunit